MAIIAKYTISNDFGQDIDVSEYDGVVSVTQGCDSVHVRLENIEDFCAVVKSVVADIELRKTFATAEATS